VLEVGVLILGVSYAAVYILVESEHRTLLLSSQVVGYGVRVLEQVMF
jgi:hypothetical protein